MSNRHAYNRYMLSLPGRHRLAIFEGYGHQDVFMGNRVHEDIFPRLIEFLDEQRG
ncbi:hypothetical protein [Halomonas koreensis]|uniref:Uncharacterized protein n=1 Tax=Halomonas koreensis TaxID=245385 RepID=A0ABU1G2J1_9GAMM|nr:hypothetical protein [Halomonas koreensis]MDR5866738.1 hypothetical protein [Halomonas koreensis]